MAYHNVLSALADPTRRTLFEAVAGQPTSVGELAATFPISRPAVSQHLKVLERAQLVTATPKGNRRIYALNPTGLEIVRRYLDGFWTDALGAYASEVQRRTNPN